jgi:hypothetical protein
VPFCLIISSSRPLSWHWRDTQQALRTFSPHNRRHKYLFNQTVLSQKSRIDPMEKREDPPEAPLWYDLLTLSGRGGRLKEEFQTSLVINPVIWFAKRALLHTLVVCYVHRVFVKEMWKSLTVFGRFSQSEQMEYTILTPICPGLMGLSRYFFGRKRGWCCRPEFDHDASMKPFPAILKNSGVWRNAFKLQSTLKSRWFMGISTAMHGISIALRLLYYWCPLR